MRKRVDLTFEEKVLKEFKKLCIDLDERVSYRLEKLMIKDLKKNGKMKNG